MMGRDKERWLLLAVVFSVRNCHGGISHKWTQSHDKIKTNSDEHIKTTQEPEWAISYEQGKYKKYAI